MAFCGACCTVRQVARSAPLAGLSRAQAMIASVPWITSPSSVSSTGTQFWPVSRRTLARVGLSALPRSPQP